MDGDPQELIRSTLAGWFDQAKAQRHHEQRRHQEESHDPGSH